MKNKVCERNLRAVNGLKDSISGAFSEIGGDRNLCRSVLGRCEDGWKIEGGEFVHLRD